MYGTYRRMAAVAVVSALLVFVGTDTFPGRLRSHSLPASKGVCRAYVCSAEHPHD